MFKMEISYPEIFKQVPKDSDDFQLQCNKLSKDIVDKQKTILNVIENLNSYLTDQSHHKREYGTHILSEVISKLSSDALSLQELHFINKFYTDRLRDHHEVIPAVLRGVLALMSQKNYPDGGCTEMLSSLFQNVSCQQQQRGDRYNIYCIFKHCLEFRSDEIKSMGLDFVYGFISAIDSEKDPRNLVFLFGWLPQLIRTVSLGHLKEEMFETVSCYFPIDFRVSAQDSMGITREALAEVLAPCLCAIDDFASDCIGLALEKLGSSMRIAKLDSLNVLKMGCGVFSEESFLLHSTELWASIQKEVYSASGDYEIESLALDTLSAIVSRISSSNTDTFKALLSNITDTSKLNLRPDAKLFSATGKILEAVTKSSKVSAEHVIKQCIPLMMNTYQIVSTIPERLIVFQQLISIVAIYSKSYNLNEMEELKLIPNLCLQAAIEDHPQIRALGLKSLGILHNALSEEIRVNFYKSMRVYLVIKQERIVREAFHHCLIQLTSSYTKEVLPVIQEVQISSEDDLIVFMDCLVEIALISDDIFQFLFQKCIGDDLNTSTHAFSALKQVFIKEESVEFLENYLQKFDLLNVLIDWVFSKLELLNTRDKMMKDVGEVLRVIVSCHNCDKQRIIVEKHLNRVIELFGLDKIDVSVFVLSGLIVRLDREVLSDFRMPDFIIEIATKTTSELVQVEAFQLIANYLNKLDSEDEITRILVAIETSSTNVDIARQVGLCTWVTKALVMRSHPQTDKWINLMVSSLKMHAPAAMGFKIVLDESYDALSTKSNCQKRLLYKQRFFTQSTKYINEAYDETTTAHLCAIAYMLEEIPQTIIKMQFEQLIRFISLGLDTVTELKPLTAIFTTLDNLLQKKDPLMESYIQTLLPRFLKLSAFKDSMYVRCSAIMCVSGYATAGYPLHKVLPFKSDVIVALGKCLDDPKRLVRNKAVAARMYWYIMDEPI